MKRIKEVNKRSEDMKCISEVKNCSDNIKLNSDYELIMLCKKCSNEVECRSWILKMKKKRDYDKMIMIRDNKKRLCLEKLKIVVQFYKMNEKLMIKERFSRRRMMMKLKCEDKERRRFKKMKIVDVERSVKVTFNI